MTIPFITRGNITLYPPASRTSERSELAKQERRYKFHPISTFPPICKKNIFSKYFFKLDKIYI
jgi:hypothetical protein